MQGVRTTEARAGCRAGGRLLLNRMRAAPLRDFGHDPDPHCRSAASGIAPGRPLEAAFCVPERSQTLGHTVTPQPSAEYDQVANR